MKRWTHYSDLTREAVLRTYQNGASVARSARAFGVHRATAWNWIKSAGITRSQREGVHIRWTGRTLDAQQVHYRRSRIQSLAAEGLSQRAIARQMGINRRTVEKVLCLGGER